MSPLKLIAVMLEYPSQELWDAADEILPLIEAECPQLLAFAACYLQAPCWTGSRNGAKPLIAVVPPQC